MRTGESFGERLRAQREAAEKLAQQRVAAARERSLQASADALTILAPHKAEAGSRGVSQPIPQSPPEPAAKKAPGDQPRFTFAQEEIVAARQETAFAPATTADPAPKAEAHHDHGPHDASGDRARNAPPPAPDQHQCAPDEPKLYSGPERHAGAPEYRHEDDALFEDDAMFERGQPTLQAAPPRASAADYSAAYREFEDEFEEEPRRRSGPMLLLASLAALAVVSGGAVYWYQQGGSTQQLEGAPPAAEAANVPVIAAPAEPAKAEPPAPQEPQQAAAPTTRKQIYDRIIGEETLEPERIVPTEEAPLRQIQQPGATEVGRESQSGEPLPLPLPPPPGTGIGEQGDLLVPGAAAIQTASAEPEPELSLPKPELSLPEPKGAADPGRHPADGGTSMAAAVEPGTGNAAAAEAAASAAVKLRGTAAATGASAPVSSRSSIYPEVTEPLAYPTVRSANSAPRDQPSEPGTGRSAALAEPQDTMQAEQEAEPETAPVAERIAAPAAEPEADQIAEAEPEGEPTSDVPLPRAKPEPPVRVTTATQPAPQPQAQASQPQAPQQERQAAAPAGSGPVQIIPTDLSQAPTARAVQPQAQYAAPARRTMGREPDPFAGPASTAGRSLVDSLNAAPSRQFASAEPAETSQPQPAATTQADPAGGYVVQLASFRSEAEALTAYQRLAQRHPQLVGNLASRVQEASLGQTGSFWRLGVGPLSSRDEAARLCNALIAAGEKDCLVRRN